MFWLNELLICEQRTTEKAEIKELFRQCRSGLVAGVLS
ncbi:hypothetical protein PEC301645_20340 [Pectobacterium carotovorum subsp. carotovorum]|nr:hypothetical protein PEC301645_20340 [Pectobacterium carotovorum subsp. carotovorum]